MKLRITFADGCRTTQYATKTTVRDWIKKGACWIDGKKYTLLAYNQVETRRTYYLYVSAFGTKLDSKIDTLLTPKGSIKKTYKDLK